jgi:hypothetical protein
LRKRLKKSLFNLRELSINEKSCPGLIAELANRVRLGVNKRRKPSFE